MCKQCLYAHFNFVNFFSSYFFAQWCWLDGAWEIKKSTLDPSCLSTYSCVHVFMYVWCMCYVCKCRQKIKRNRTVTTLYILLVCGTLVNTIIIIISSNKLLFHYCYYYYCSLSLVSSSLRERNKNRKKRSFPSSYSLAHMLHGWWLKGLKCWRLIISFLLFRWKILIKKIIK